MTHPHLKAWAKQKWPELAQALQNPTVLIVRVSIGLLLCGWMLFAVVFDDRIKRRI